MIRFGVVGTGWRTEFFLRVARACPDRLACVGVVSRDPQGKAAWAAPYGVPLFATIDELLAQKPLFVVTSVPWEVNPHMIEALAAQGMPVLSETPPAPSVEWMTHLYRLIGQGAKIAVAEQFHLKPQHAARLAFAHSGKLGRISQAQVSIGHGYHGISLIRRFLGIGYENATITAHRFTAPLITPGGRGGAPDAEGTKESGQAIAVLDFGDRSAVFDFNDDQYFSPVRRQRLTVRGERGEIIDSTAVYMRDHLTPVTAGFQRIDTGGVLEGIQADGEWVYRNPLAPAPLDDEDVAVGDCLLKMADYADGGEAFYPLAEACQDRYLDIMIWKSIESGQPVKTETQVWSS
jgi:predicted dehydrogenase